MKENKKKGNLKINKNLVAIICVALIILLAFIIQYSLSKYTLKETQEHAQESSNFYFESDLADVETENFVITDDIEEIEFYVRNYENEDLYTEQTTYYTITATTDADDITVTILDENKDELSGSQSILGGSCLQNNYILKISKDSSYQDESFTINVKIESTSPYTKEMSSTIQVTGEEQAENEVSLEILNDSEYAKLSITTNVLEEIKITYDTTKLKLDESSLGVFTEDDDVITLAAENIELNETYSLIFIILDEGVSIDDFSIE